MSRVPESAGAPETDPNRQQVNQIEVDDHAVSALYANFVRVTGSPEELIIDFALNPQPMMTAPTQPIRVAQRVVVNFYTAKRLLGALIQAVKRHEDAFGVLEVDVQKRIRPQVRPTS